MIATMFPMVTPDGIETGRCYNHMCRAAKRSRGSFRLSLHRRLLAAAGLAFLVTSSAAFAQGGPPAMPVSVSTPVAKRVTQWDEFSAWMKDNRLLENAPDPEASYDNGLLPGSGL